MHKLAGIIISFLPVYYIFNVWAFPIKLKGVNKHTAREPFINGNNIMKNRMCLYQRPLINDRLINWFSF